MLAQVTKLRYWKSEHDEQTCEDAYGEDTANGLFAVADGAGTTLFSNIWARVLIEHFLSTPLMSNNPFEIEWWVRLAQEQFKQEAPGLENMAWNALQKAQNQGSHATLATLRVTNVETARAQAELLVFGDSCVIISKSRTEQVWSFPLGKPSDFDRAPICVPSKLSMFNRYFHRCLAAQVDLEPGDSVILATDAVAKWIISAGGGCYQDQRSAFQAVVAQTPDSWPIFITECRTRKEMVDDDSMALIITLTDDTLKDGLSPGATTEHSKSVREQRKQNFAQALDAQNKELVAIYFGDGVDLDLEQVQLSDMQIQQARAVADALREVLAVLRQELNAPDVVDKMTIVWQKHAELLNDEPCAENLRRTLTRLGVLAPTVEWHKGS